MLFYYFILGRMSWGPKGEMGDAGFTGKTCQSVAHKNFFLHAGNNSNILKHFFLYVFQRNVF